MIKDSMDFDYAINKIITDTETTILPQGEYLNSKNINETFKNIETSLNELYEKTRFLEDSIQYAKVFLDAKVKEFNDEMDSIIKELENTTDMSKNLSYLSHNVPLKENTVDINNRDSTMPKLKPLILKDKKLTLGYSMDLDIDYSSVIIQSDSIVYDDTPQSKIISDKSYKAIFLEEKVARNGLTQTFTVYFKNPKTINMLDFITSNCNIKNIRFGLINGIEEYAHDYSINMLNVNRTCVYVKFDLVCTNYNTIIYELDKDKITNNLWNDLRKYEKAKTVQLDKINKLNAEYIISRTSIDSLTGKASKESFQSSNNKKVIKVEMYAYVFGLDRLNFKYINKLTEGYFISEPISIGRLDDLEYITLDVSHSKIENCSIEYSILDEENEIPIVPIGEQIIENELILNTKDSRFLRDSDTTSEKYIPEVIKKDGQITNIYYEDAKLMNDGMYTITYKPNASYHECKPINGEVRVKCCIRTFGQNLNEVPYIDMITIRKFGDDALWINKY